MNPAEWCDCMIARRTYHSLDGPNLDRLGILGKGEPAAPGECLQLSYPGSLHAYMDVNSNVPYALFFCTRRNHLVAAYPASSEAEFLHEFQTKVFLLAIYSHLYSFVLRFSFLPTHATSYSFYSSVTVQYTVRETGGKPDRKAYGTPFPMV
jgi:hypothetical protein